MKDTQIHIIRQSSLKFINDYMTLVGTPLGMFETVTLAELVTEYVLNGRTKEVNDRLKNFDKYLIEETARDLIDKVKFELQNS
jgi:hypothetical protein